MVLIRKAEDRGHADHGWLKARHSFSFADYYDPRWMGFRSLRVINDDRIAPGHGFGRHPHRDMEIITILLEGALEHQDSMGNGRIIRAGEVQYMAAGSGVEHSEFNPSTTESTHLLQIWILPDRRGVAPRYAERSFRNMPTGSLVRVASKLGSDDSISIHQDVDLFLARLNPGDSVHHSLQTGRHAWIQVAAGEVEMNGIPLSEGDGAALSDESQVSLLSRTAAQVLVFDLN